MKISKQLLMKKKYIEKNKLFRMMIVKEVIQKNLI